MELLNLIRIIPIELRNQIEEICIEFAGSEAYCINWGQLTIGDEPLSDGFTFDLIASTVCGHFNAPKTKVISRTRKQPFMTYRQIVIWFTKKYTNLKYDEIGYEAGGFDHTTVTHAIKTVDGYITSGKNMRDNINRLDLKINRILKGR